MSTVSQRRFHVVSKNIFEEWKWLKSEIENDMKTFLQEGKVTDYKEAQKYSDMITAIMNEMVSKYECLASI